MVVINSVDGRVAGVNRPCQGQKVSGDAIFSFALDSGVVVGIADGLGHGLQAHAISLRIKRYIEKNNHSDILRLLNDAHNAIAPCDGAAVGLAYINFEEGECSFAAVGNISAYIIGNNDKSFVFQDGMIGARMRTPLLQTEKLMAGDKIFVISDGIKERFYSHCDRSLLKNNPASVVEMLLKSYGKCYDDASCWVIGF